MKIDQFLDHHGIAENPFGQEDAQTDHVFQDHCLDGTHHPAWDKIYSSPDHPATSVVFGEKGSGKTALRMQIAGKLKQHNREHPERRAFIIEYDDFNPFLDAFRERLPSRKRRPERAVANWRLWDHMDAILSLGATQLVESIVDSKSRDESEAVTPEQLARLSHLQRRDLLLLAAFYDHSLDLSANERWKRLRRKLRFPTWWSEWDRLLGVVVTAATIGLVLKFGDSPRDLLSWTALAVVVAGWLPWIFRQIHLYWTARRVAKQVRVIEHLPNMLRKILARFPRHELAGQPIPSKERGDDRYELLRKFQSILDVLGFTSIIVLVDRVDEPHLINGNAERIRELIWPMFDNKFLKHPGIGFKLLLPSEVLFYLNREEKEFYERSRLDKQNLISSFIWTGESLYDIANDRIAACAMPGGESTPTIRSLFDEAISQQELIGIFSRLRVPRHLFKFLYRVLVNHCSRFTVDNPQWTISRETLESTLAVYMRDMEALDRGMGTG